LLSYEIVGGPFQVSALSAALHGDYMVAGDFSNDQGGAVQVYQYGNNSWTEYATIVSPNTDPDSTFGSDVAMDQNGLLVGASGVVVPGTNVEAGAAFYYELVNGSWSQLGSMIQEATGAQDLGAANQKFGFAVATSGAQTGQLERRIVIGAPKTSLLNPMILSAGQVYTFAYNDTLKDWQGVAAIMAGTSENDEFGSSVALSSDGSRLLVGAPGSGSGYAVVYDFDPSQMIWTEVRRILGGDDESLGSSVAFLTASGSVFAVGGPDFGDNQGRIKVYAEESFRSFAPLGTLVVGLPNEKLGRINSIAGSTTQDDQPSLVCSTALGTVIRYDYDASNSTWIQIFEPVSVQATSLTAVATGATADDIVVVNGASATIFSLGGGS
jgi:FG-GAP repeat